MKGFNSCLAAWVFFWSLSGFCFKVQPPYPIRNHLTDHTNQFEYSLKDERIYVRSLNETVLKTFKEGDLVSFPQALDFHLFDQLGFPYKNNFWNNKKPLLSGNEKLAEIAVASEVLLAVSNQDRIYFYKPTVLERPLAWTAKEGAPFEGALYLPSSRRAWSFSCSVRDKDIRRVDFMDPNDRIIYYTDGNGTQHDFGFTATIYTLLEDGRRIAYWDTGLPPSFSRGFLTPLLGETQGQSLSAAGSTIFVSVVDKKGQLRYFTRMYDYEINGACPGLRFTYGPLKEPPPLVGGTVPLGFSLRKLPLEGWREHILTGIPQEQLTSQVSIHTCGQGNAARELRIQGTNRKGESGYYYKYIDTIDWHFRKDRRLEPAVRIPFPYRAGPSLLKDYEGAVRTAPAASFSVELKGFHPFLTAEEPSTLRVTANGQSTEIALHSVDGWGIVAHKRFHEDLIGVDEGEPKSLRATLVLTEEQRNCSGASPLCEVLQKNFVPYHERVNEIRLIADDEDVFLRTNDGNIKLYFHRAATQDEIDSSFFMKKAMNPDLRAKPKDREHLLELISLNEKALSEIKAIRRTYRRDSEKLMSLSLLALPVIPFAEYIFRVSKGDPTYLAAAIDATPLLKNHVQLEWSSLKETRERYEESVQILKERIQALKKHSRIKDTPWILRLLRG